MALFAQRYGDLMLAVSKRTVALRSLIASVIFGGIAVLAACSSDKPAAATCDSSKCAPGNTCLPLNGETKCRKTCSSNSDPATSCPFGYTCTDTLTGVSPFCVADNALGTDGKPIVKKPTGQWGFSCQANQGQTNPSCDTDQGFYCFALSKTDGAAYCTRYGCEKDADCGAGFWCATVNTTPNADQAKRALGDIGKTQQVCLRRTYCSTCAVDLDCPPIAGKAQHCVADANGATFCTPECDTDQACPNEAKCSTLDTYKICYPRAKLCVGDGSLCSPCRSDADCGDDGACVRGQYTTERSCAKKAPSSCGTSDKAEKGGCPDTATVSTKKTEEVRCLGQFFPQVPIDYCHGVYSLGSAGQQAPDIGCYTPDR